MVMTHNLSPFVPARSGDPDVMSTDMRPGSPLSRGERRDRVSLTD